MQSAQITEPRTRRWTYEEYYQMADLGFFEGQRVELIDGEIIEMAPQKDPHTVAIGLGQDALANAFGTGFWVRVQMPMRLQTNTEPEPDLAVVRGGPREHLGKGHVFEPLLVVEISETTLAYDRGRKACLYAAAGIKDYWIVNLIDRQVEICRDPVADASQKFGSRYAAIQPLGPGQTVAPLALPNLSIAVADLLP